MKGREKKAFLRKIIEYAKNGMQETFRNTNRGRRDKEKGRRTEETIGVKKR